jgi:hypothetical protein
MSAMESNRSAESARGPLPAFPHLDTFKFSRRQHEHLQWLVGQRGEPIVCKDPASTDHRSKLIIVPNPPTGPQVETFCRSLPADAVVVIPFGENPVFDFLKSKLVNHGTIAPSGADGPHTLWWGSRGLNDFTKTATATAPLVISCFDRSSGAADADRLVKSLQALGLDHVVEPVDGVAPGCVTGIEKAQFIADVLEKAGRPILYVDPDATFRRPPLLLETVECDVAIHRWRNWELSTRTLYFGCTAEAKAVLQTWKHFIRTCPTVGDGYLLDQAWSLVASQAPLRTLWLPRSYHAATENHEPLDTLVVVHNLGPHTRELNPLDHFPGALQAARRACRTGAPEAQLVLKSSATDREAVVVLIRDVQATGTYDVAATVRDVAQAFSSNPGGFSRLELSMCRWLEDFNAGLSAAEQTGACVVVIEPTAYVWDRLFVDAGKRVSADAQNRVLRIRPQTSDKVFYRH